MFGGATEMKVWCSCR